MVTLAFIGCVFGVFIKRAMMFIGGAVTFMGGAMIFIGMGSLVIEGRSFKTVEAGVNRHDLR